VEWSFSEKGVVTADEFNIDHVEISEYQSQLPCDW